MKKRGFAFIELLVLIAIIALLLTLLFPAIQQSRQQAHQQRCRNNLKQLGLALHNYESVFSVFPPGWISREGYPGSGARYGWQCAILPFVDQAPLYNMINFNKTPAKTDGSPAELFQKALPVFRCPADPTPDLNPLRDKYATSNYSGNYGDVPARPAPLGLSDVWPGAQDAPMRSRGIFARNSSEGLTDITDGTSNTFAIGERGFASGAGIWAGVTDNAHSDDAVTDCSHLSRPNRC